jgi:hypothetical protein
MTRPGSKQSSPHWARIDTGLMRSPNVLQLLSLKHGHEAFAVYLDSILWAQANLTDGLIPHFWRPATGRINGSAESLCRVELWIEVTDAMREPFPGEDASPLASGQWLISGFHAIGVTRAEWTAGAARRKERAQKAAAARWSGTER